MGKRHERARNGATAMCWCALPCTSYGRAVMQFQTRTRIALRHYACVVVLQIQEQNRVGANALSTPMTQIDSTHRRAQRFSPSDAAVH
jgi:hypothetical protein